MFGKRESASKPPETSREAVDASPQQIADLTYAVRAAWHGLDQGRDFLPPQYTHYFDNDTAVIKLEDGHDGYQEARLVLEEDGQSWTVQTVTVWPGDFGEFLRATYTYPVAVSAEVTTEVATCELDNNHNLQPVSEPTLRNMGKITDIQVQNIYESLVSVGALET